LEREHFNLIKDVVDINLPVSITTT